jgi:hypothetical protein
VNHGSRACVDAAVGVGAVVRGVVVVAVADASGVAGCRSDTGLL